MLLAGRQMLVCRYQRKTINLGASRQEAVGRITVRKDESLRSHGDLMRQRSLAKRNTLEGRQNPRGRAVVQHQAPFSDRT